MGANARLGFAGFAVTVLMVTVGYVSYGIAEGIGIRALHDSTSHRIDIYSASLQAEMKRFEYLPQVIALDEHVISLLEQSDDEAKDAVNRYLHTVSVTAGASASYLMDRNGLTLAASNWDQPGSFVNMNFAYRPYFQDAIKGIPGRFYGIGTVSREPGYYFSHTVSRNGKVLGVAAVKVNLERLDEAWGHEGEKIVVADGNGVVFLSSESNWKYRTLSSLSSETIGRLAATRQYTEAGMLSPLGMREQRSLADGSAIVQIDSEPIEKRAPGSSVDYLVQSAGVLGTNWRLLVMSELTPARAAARNSAALAVLTFVLLATLALYFQQRRRIIRQTLAARLALERANDELERNVEERTLALRDANRQLQGEIIERRRAEEALRATLVDLVHTAKMAVLGQMSAGITHELNQPLTALRTLSNNALVLLKRGHSGQVATNLEMIARLTDHMGKITSQLKKFARKSPPELQPVVVATVLTDALFLLTQSMRSNGLTIDQRIDPPDATAMCDANRLEQILLNLLGNAIDAVEGSTAPRILLRVSVIDEWIDIEVHDNGHGIAEHVAPRLFEPFFSTKEQGMGLGLGLAISADIARDLGGGLRASESALLGGAMFVVRLKAFAAMEAIHA